MIGRGLATLAFLLAVSVSASAQEVRQTVLELSDLTDWHVDDHEKALEAFLITCPDMDSPDWRALCAVAQGKPNAKEFFQLFFRPVLMEDGKRALFTGYFEPELSGSLVQTERFRFPLYRKPPEAKSSNPWLTRRQIETGASLQGRGLEIVWVDDLVEKFFLQIQGSGRVRLPDGRMIRVGYGGANGHEYRSIGAELVRRGIYKAHQVSAQVIKNWVRRNPVVGKELLWHNPSYVFFRRIDSVPPHMGPLGAMNRSVTTGRTVAVDPKFVPLGAPVWIEKEGTAPIRRLMIAQDTGSAIKGAQRADIFFGTGDDAGRQAGRIRDPGRMLILLPIQRAYASATEPDQ